MNLYESPIARRYKERYNSQPPEIKEKLDNYEDTDYQLKVIKKSKPNLNVGDVFLLSPRENVYFYGKVLKTNIKSIRKNMFIEGKQTVFIHKCKTNQITIDDFKPDYKDLLIDPAIVDISYWRRGFFYNVGNLPLTDVEKSLDYGFFKSGLPGREGWFCTEEGEKLSDPPRIMGIYGIATIIGIAAEVTRELIMNPLLLSE